MSAGASRTSSAQPAAARDCDYIIVGAGSAGCVAAWRLLNETSARVVVLEAGADYRSPYLKLSPGYSRLVPKGIHCTLHHTVPQRHADNRVLEIATGRVVGGGSSVNAQVYMRGFRSDYDDWGRATGSPLWSWDSILPHFRRLEGNQKYDGEFHGSAGPLQVADPGYFCEYSHLYVKAAQASGLPFTADFNRGAPAGTGYLQFTARGGRRCSGADAYLAPLRSNERLRIVTHAQVERIIFDGDRAIGVEYLRNGTRHRIYCSGEVLLSAGAFGSPKLLMLSGVGPAAELERLGLPVRVGLKGVGQNLQDHCGSPLVLEGQSRGDGYYRQDRGWRLAWNLLEYALFRRGRLTTVGGEATSFHATEAARAGSTVQIYCVPMIAYANTGADTVPDVDGIKLHVTLLRPWSVGSMTLRSANPADPPLVDPNYLGDPRDLRYLVDGLRIARSLAATAPLAGALRGEMLPGADVADDEALARYVRRTVRTDWHPVGTCRMGREDDPASVLDDHLRVLGTRGLRVVDASAMPNIVGANTNAPTMALADRALSLLIGRSEAPPRSAERPSVRVPPNGT
ncbi:MAG: GMC family oxidoreductase N-terminal domain-containing protein [Proteobacteria bacterium]|nr:GMC family oxidoreductase N-terminal domain-containing protein [Pseudomonadota bacterium]